MSDTNDPLKNGAIFRLNNPPPVPISPLEDQSNDVKNVFDNLYRASILPAIKRPQLSSFSEDRPVSTSPNYWSDSQPDVLYSVMLPSSIPLSEYSNSAARKSSEPLKLGNFSYVPEPQELMNTTFGKRFEENISQKDSILVRSQSVPPSSTALTAPVNAVNVPEGRSESTGRILGRGSRLASGGNTGLAALASSILTGPSVVPVRSVPTSNGSVNNSSARTKVDGTRTTAPTSPGNSSVRQVVTASALMGPAPGTSSSSNGGTVNRTVIHSPPVKKKTPKHDTAVTTEAGRATSTPAGAAVALPTVAAPTVTRSGRIVIATKRLIEEVQKGNNSSNTLHVTNNNKSQPRQCLVAVNVNESDRRRIIRALVCQAVSRRKGSQNWELTAKEVNERLKEGPEVTEEDCLKIYKETEATHKERTKGNTSVLISDSLTSSSSSTNANNNNNNNSRLDKRDDEKQPEKRKRVTQKTMKSMAIAASQSERQDDLFDKLDNGYNTTLALVRGSGVESIKTPAAGNKSSQPGNRRLNNDQSNSNEEDDSDDDDESGYIRLVSNNRGKGGGEDSPEITFDRRVAKKLILSKKNFAASMIESTFQKNHTNRNHAAAAAAAAAMRRRVTTVSDDDFKGSIDPYSGLVHIVPHLAADSASEGESDEENFGMLS